jgi:hypothetical protein
MATAAPARAHAVHGKTIRWTFADRPTAGTTFEHEFKYDGTVVFRTVDRPADRRKAAGAKADDPAGVPYRSARVSDDVHAVSYKAPGGHTLTVVLNFAEGTAARFASNDKEWTGQTGTFEVVG